MGILHYCTPRALILANGNLQRALVIIGNPEFHLSAQASLDLSYEQRAIFLPFLEPPIQHSSNRSVIPNKYLNIRLYKFILSINNHPHGGGRGLSSEMRKFLLDAEKMRALREDKYTPVDYSDTLYKSYFSTQYTGTVHIRYI
jgi:hypothetical protein